MPVDTFTIVLGTPKYYNQLYAFAKGKKGEAGHSTENFDFLAAAYAYKKNPSKKEAIAIIDKYVARNAPNMLNLESKNFKTLNIERASLVAQREQAKSMNFFMRHWSAGERKAAENVFDDAIKVILRLLRGDVYVRWLKTDEGIEAEKHIGEVMKDSGPDLGPVLLQIGLQ